MSDELQPELKRVELQKQVDALVGITHSLETDIDELKADLDNGEDDVPQLEFGENPVGETLQLPFMYAGVDPSSSPANNKALFNTGWIEVVTAGDDALIPTPTGDADGNLIDDTIPADSLTLEEDDNFVVAHFHRHATVLSSTCVLARYDTWSDIPTTTNNDFYYLLALVTLKTTSGKGTQELVRQYRAGIIKWNAKPKTLTYCDGGTTHTYDIPAFEPVPLS